MTDLKYLGEVEHTPKEACAKARNALLRIEKLNRYRRALIELEGACAAMITIHADKPGTRILKERLEALQRAEAEL